MYDMIMLLLISLNTNVQNKDRFQLKADAASFMEIEVSDNCEIKPSTKKMKCRCYGNQEEEEWY